MANEIVSTTTSTDQEKFLALDLIKRSYLKLVMGSLCDKVQMKKGAGLTANFVRYKRMSVPLSPITEGTDPANSSFALDSVTVTLDQWGDIITVTDVAQLTTFHPLVQQCVELLADNAARVMDREITLVLLAGTNLQFGDGSVATRDTITPAMKVNENVIGKARVNLVNAGAPPRGGPAGDARQVAAQGNFQQGIAYVAVTGAEVIQDVMQPSTSFGTFVSAAVYNNFKALSQAEVGMWLGFRFVETNFLPKFILLGDAVVLTRSGAGTTNNANSITGLTVVVANAGGTLGNATFGWKLTRKDLLRGFEEAISIPHTITTGGATSLITITVPSTAGFVYNIYFDTNGAGGSTTDAGLSLVASNIAAGAATAISAVPVAGTTPPNNILATNGPAAVYPVFVFAEAAVGWVGFYKPKFLITSAAAEKVDPLAQFRTVGYKFFGKSVIKDQTRLLRLEVASTF